MHLSSPLPAMTMLLLLFTLFASHPHFVHAKRGGSSITNNTHWENMFLQSPDRMLMREVLMNYTSAPHIAGSTEDYATALYTQAKFEEFGIPTVIETHDVLLSYPLKRLVEIVYPENLKYVASLTEPALAEDPTSNDPRIVNTFNGYAPSGNVTAELVYANYGTLQDFQYLVSMGVNVTGKIVIVRYGNIFRGVKVMIAQQYGAVGVLIYSDPINDGFLVGGTYPNGPWRPEEGVQRGSVQYLSKCAGDPLDTADCLPEGATGGYEGTLIPNIPVQPLSWGDASPLLAAITNNPVSANSNWTGGIPNITYAMGPGPVVVHLETEISFNKTTIWNVVGTINGEDKDNIVLIGNHRDAWVFGATDPSSGSTILMEIARIYGYMLTQGWKPLRTIQLCSWDAEEYGLVGSTAFARTHKQTLISNAVAYLNVDVGVGGMSFGAGGTPSLRYVIEEAAQAVSYPGNPSMTLFDQWGVDQLAPLGSGSDYTAFLDNLGVASMDAGFWNLSGGVYHSNYDSFYWMDTFGDHGFYYHQSMVQFLGLLGIKIVDATVLPHNYVNYAAKLSQYATSVSSMLNPTAPEVDLSGIVSATKRLNTVGGSIEDEKPSLSLQGNKNSLLKMNNRLVQTERQFIYSKGLPGRPFYKHVVQAPALYNGYGCDVFPGLMQAVRDKDWKLAKQQAQIIEDRINAAADTLSGKSETSHHKKAVVIISVVLSVSAVAAIGGFLYWRKMRAYKYTQV